MKKVHIAFDKTTKYLTKWCVWCDCCNMIDSAITVYDDFAEKVGSFGVVKVRTFGEAVYLAAKHYKIHNNRAWISEPLY